jgi:hypothetical protein
LPELHGVQEFLAAEFSPRNEKSHIITLVGDPGWSVLLWQWDHANSSKILSKIDLTKKELLRTSFDGSTSLSSSFMLSLHQGGVEMYATVTGPDLFQLFKISQENQEFEIKHSQLN